MASAEYIAGRKKYSRPQAMLWAENPGTIAILNPETDNEQQIYVPEGYETGSNESGLTDNTLFEQFMILTDDNRGPIDFSVERIEKRERMINGRMRSYHIADKLTISASWDMIPSRAYSTNPSFSQTTGKSTKDGIGTGNDEQFTTDGGAGGIQMINWYDNHKGSFWVYLAYDKEPYSQSIQQGLAKLGRYSQVIEMYFADFSYSVVKRGNAGHDLWNVSVTLEEV